MNGYVLRLHRPVRRLPRLKYRKSCLSASVRSGRANLARTGARVPEGVRMFRDRCRAADRRKALRRELQALFLGTYGFEYMQRYLSATGVKTQRRTKVWRNEIPNKEEFKARRDAFLKEGAVAHLGKVYPRTYIAGTSWYQPAVQFVEDPEPVAAHEDYDSGAVRAALERGLPHAMEALKQIDARSN